MATIRISNIEAKADGGSPSIDEKVTFKRSTGENSVVINAKQVGITSVGINTDNPISALDIVGDIRNAGSITATGNVTAYSDIRLKDDILRITNPIEKINQINGVTFTRNDTDITIRYSGVIAQEVEKVLPEVIFTDKNGIKTVAYGNMVGLLIEAIKDQQIQIEGLKNEIKDLKQSK